MTAVGSSSDKSGHIAAHNSRFHLFVSRRLYLICSRNKFISQMFPDGAQSITEVTKRPVTAGMNFKNSIIALVEKNLSLKVSRGCGALSRFCLCICIVDVVAASIKLKSEDS